MKAYHRIVGDPPKFGFAGAISSVGFPGANWALAVSDRRLPPKFGVPFAKEQEETVISDGKSVTRTQCSYELQALTFQCAAAVYSTEGMAGTSRPHGYSDMVALVAEEGETTTVEQWLTFDGFMTLSEFWALTANTVSYEVKDWTPQAHTPNACSLSISEEMHQALCMRYWRAATAKLFDAGARLSPVRVCLSEERVGERIIPLAKAFFSAYILPALPGAARHLVSMSAPVAAKYVQKYDPTALVFLYPESVLSESDEEKVFDLRTGAFTPLDAQEAAFARQVMSGRRSGYMQRLYETSCKLLGNAMSENDTTFMADFDVAWALYRLENSELSAQERVALWRNVHEWLTRRHGLSDGQADQLLAGFEAEWLKGMENQAIALTDADFAFLMAKALRTGSRQMTDLLALHQQARYAPFFGSNVTMGMLDASTPENIKAVFGALLHEAWLKQPIGQGELDVLYAEAFQALCNAHPALGECVTGYLNAFNSLHPDKALFIMPLGKLYLDHNGVLRMSILQLKNEYTLELPGEVACRSIREATGVMSADNLSLLNDFYVEAFRNHASNALPFVAMCQSMGQDTTQALAGILAQPATYDNQQLNLTLAGLLPLAADRQAVHGALMDYAARILAKAEQDDVCVLRWFDALDAEGSLILPAERAQMGVEHFAKVYQKLGMEPNPGDFELVKRWMGMADAQQKRSFEQLLKPLYNAIAPAGLAQVSQFWSAFSTLTDAPHLREAHVGQLVQKLVGDWARAGYFQAIEAQRPQWALSQTTAQELMANPTVKAQATGKLERQFAALAAGDDFVQAHERIRAEQQDSFAAYAYRMLNERFAKSYQQMVMNAKSVEDVEALEALSRKLGAESNVSSNPARRCANAMMQVNGFFATELPSLADDQLPQRAQAMAQLLNAMPEGPVGSHVHALMSVEAQKHTQLPLRKRMAAALITAGRALDDRTFHAKNAVELLAWENEAASPFAAKGAALFTQLCALMDLAQAVNPDYVPLLLRAVSKYHPDYPKRLKGVQKQIRAALPWYPNGDAPQAFVAWLNQCMNLK